MKKLVCLVLVTIMALGAVSAFAAIDLAKYEPWKGDYNQMISDYIKEANPYGFKQKDPNWEKPIPDKQLKPVAIGWLGRHITGMWPTTEGEYLDGQTIGKAFKVTAELKVQMFLEMDYDGLEDGFYKDGKNYYFLENGILWPLVKINYAGDPVNALLSSIGAYGFQDPGAIGLDFWYFLPGISASFLTLLRQAAVAVNPAAQVHVDGDWVLYRIP